MNSSPEEPMLNETVFTIYNGKLHQVSPQNNQISISNLDGDDWKFSEDDEEFYKRGKDEVYIEIFRENSLPSDLSVNEDDFIQNISSAYEAFWKGNFKNCLVRRTCPKCSHTFLTPKQLFDHLDNIHSISCPEVCFVCYKVFTSELEKCEHVLKVHQIPSTNFTCEVCYQHFLNESEKNAHQLQHPSTDKCKWCSASYPCKFLLSVHHRQCLYLKKRHSCSICGCHFTSSQILQLHSLRHNRKLCGLCGIKVCDDVQTSCNYHEINLIKHLRSMHNDEEIEKVLLGLKKQDEEEEILDRLFMAQIESKIPELNGVEWTDDSSVPEDENSLKSMNLTINTEKQDMEKKTNVIILDTTFQCSECSQSFDSKKKLMVHALDHQTPYSCDICKMAFQHRRSFKKHMRCHGMHVKPGSIRYKCMQCSVNCSTLSGLHTHILTHTEHKPHLCDKCGLTFRRLQALRMHDISIHNAKTLHTCPQCGSSSTSKKSLLRHIQCVHAGVRRFICGLCSARFLQNQDLRRHLKSVHKLVFPPLQCLLKKSNSQIHIIPSAENISPSDPLAAILKSTVREEELKLMKFSKHKKISTSYCDTQPESLKTEASADGLSLNILGDVASKAVPLEQIKPCHFDSLQNNNAKLQENSKLLCAGRQNGTSNTNECSTHSQMCKPSKLQPVTTQAESVDAASTSKHTVMYSLTPFQATPYNLCVLSSALPNESAIPTINNDGFICSIVPGLHDGLNASHSTSLNAPSLTDGFICSSDGSTTNFTVSLSNQQDFPEGESVSQNDSSRILNMLSVTGLDQAQLEVLGPSSIEEEYLSKVNKHETDHLSYSEGSFMENSYQASGDLEIKVNISDSCMRHLSQPGKSRLSVRQNVTTSNQFIPYEECVKISCQGADDILGPVESMQSAPPCKTTSVINDKTHDPEPAQKSSIDNNNQIEDLVNISGPEDYISTEIKIEKPRTPRLFKSCGTSGALPVKNSSRTKDVNKTTGSDQMSTSPMACPECGKKLSSASNFRRHLKVHSGVKPHECLYCGKSFRYKHNLTVHIRSHTGDRPYECTICSKKFRYQTEFKEHKQIHETSKLFSCLDCGQRFARQRDLKRHSLSHNSQSKPTCSICQKTFSRIDYLNIHRRSHRKLEEIEVEKCSFESKKKIIDMKVSKEDSCKTVRKSIKKLVSCSSSNETNQDLCADRTSSSNNSEDLISLAFQAAEDGVEFMFVEESTNLLKENSIETQMPSLSENVILIKVLE